MLCARGHGFLSPYRLLLFFPELTDLKTAFPALSNDKLGHDVAYPAMLTLLPPGLLGLVAASLIAAFMSTMSTQLNLGASYLVNDFYHRFVNPDASEKQLVPCWTTLYGNLYLFRRWARAIAHQRRTSLYTVTYDWCWYGPHLHLALVLVAN